MKIYSYNGSGFGNAVFSQYAAILFAILFDAEIVNIEDKSKIQEYYDTYTHVDDAYFMDIVNAKIERNETIIDINQNYFLIGYYQHDSYFVKYKKEIIEYIERNPSQMIFASHYSKPYQLIDIIEKKDVKEYDVVIHIRLGDFIKLAWTMDPNSLIDVIETLDKKESICIVMKEPVTELEKKYVKYILSYLPNAIIENNENPITDYNIMRNARTLVCSCSTFSWVASFMGCENQLVYFPNYQSRWNHEKFRKPHDMIVYYEFKRCSEIDLWNILGNISIE
jgi:hypothetical protein